MAKGKLVGRAVRAVQRAVKAAREQRKGVERYSEVFSRKEARSIKKNVPGARPLISGSSAHRRQVRSAIRRGEMAPLPPRGKRGPAQRQPMKRTKRMPRAPFRRMVQRLALEE